MDIKKLTILNVVLTIAVVILFAMHFMGGKAATTSNTDVKVTDDKTEAVDSGATVVTPIINNLADGNLKVAWVDRKKVSEQFDLSIQMTKQLQDEQIQAETKIMQMQSSLEKKIKTFEKDAKMMGNTEIQLKQQELGELQQKYQLQAQQMEQDLAVSSQNKQIGYAEISDEYMIEIAQELGFDYIVSYSLGGDVWCANPALDVTDVTIKKLNEKFATSDLNNQTDAASADQE